MTASDPQQLARFTPDYEPGDPLSAATALEGLYLALRGHAQSQRALELPTAEEVTAADLATGLALSGLARRDLDAAEIAIIEAAMQRGMTWEALARQAGLAMSGDALRHRYRRLGGARSFPAGRRAAAGYL